MTVVEAILTVGSRERSAVGQMRYVQILVKTEINKNEILGTTRARLQESRKFAQQTRGLWKHWHLEVLYEQASFADKCDWKERP